MADFSAFLSQNKIKKENLKFVASKNFKDKTTGEYMVWEIRALSAGEVDALQKSCIKQVKVPGKANSYRPEIDGVAYVGKLAAACTVFPDLNDREIQDSYGVMGADELLKAMLTPGEYAEYQNKVNEVNDFDVTADELVDEAKN